MGTAKVESGMLPKLLDIRELAARYRVKVVTVRQWRREGRIPGPDVRIGSRAFWTDTTIQEWEQRETWRKEQALRPSWEKSRRRMAGRWPKKKQDGKEQSHD